MRKWLSNWCGALRAICLGAIVFVVVVSAQCIANSAFADVLTDALNFPRDNDRAVDMANFEMQLCRDKEQVEGDTYQCIIDALREIYRKVPNPVVGIDLLIDHYERLTNIWDLVFLDRTMTPEQGTAKGEASYKMFQAQLNRRQKAAKDYLATLVQQQQDQQQAADQAAAEAEQQAKKRKFNDAIGELGRQLLQPKVYEQPTAAQSRTTDQTGCFPSGERTEGFNKLCYYRCLGGPFVLNLESTDICPLSLD